MRHQKLRPAPLVASIQHAPVGQHDAHRLQHTVTVRVCPAAHARGVVHHNAAHHCRFDAGGVGREVLAVGLQYLVHTLPDNPGLQRNSLIIFA